MSCCTNEEESGDSAEEGKAQSLDGVGDMATRNWGRWGEHDEKGAANLINSDTVKAGAALVRKGRVFSLAMPLDAKHVPVTPGRFPPQHFMRTDGEIMLRV